MSDQPVSVRISYEVSYIFEVIAASPEAIAALAAKIDGLAASGVTRFEDESGTVILRERKVRYEHNA